MGELKVMFEFEIGEIVFVKSACHTIDSRPVRFMVVERIAQECHGGVQRLYKLDGVSGHRAEITLTRDEPDYREESEAAKKERRDILTEQYLAGSVAASLRRRKASPEETATED